MTTRKKCLLCFVLAGVPLAYVLFPFAWGLFNLSPLELSSLAPIIFLSPILAGIVTAVLLQNISKLKRIAIGILATVTLFATFFVLPSGEKGWTLGMSQNFKLTRHPAQVQQWAGDILAQYESGKLAVTNSCFQRVIPARLKDSDMPLQIKSSWPDKPSIGIATFTEDRKRIIAYLASYKGTVPLPQLPHCVVMSWGGAGYLVGRPDFKSEWNVWSLYEISPGIYAFSNYVSGWDIWYLRDENRSATYAFDE